jgi:hypothetical protein
MAMRAPHPNQAGETWLRSASLPSAATPSGTKLVQIETADHISPLLFCVNSFFLYVFCLSVGIALSLLKHAVLAIV